MWRRLREAFEKNVDAWLPWILGGAATLVLIVGLVLGFVRSEKRVPAGFIEISDSEVPADSIYAAETAESLRKSPTGPRKNSSRNRDTHGASGDASGSFVVTLNDAPTTAEIEARTGIRAVRARAVVLASDQLRSRQDQETRLRIVLFPDVAPVFTMKRSAGFDVNQGLRGGTAADDPKSSAHFQIENGMVSGFLVYDGKEYRIVADPERAIHYIIEVKRD